MKERYYSESLLRGLAYDDDVNSNCDGTIDFTVIDSISGADVAPVRHGEWEKISYTTLYKCSACTDMTDMPYQKNLFSYCPNCGAYMKRGNKNG